MIEYGTHNPESRTATLAGSRPQSDHRSLYDWQEARHFLDACEGCERVIICDERFPNALPLAKVTDAVLRRAFTRILVLHVEGVKCSYGSEYFHVVVTVRARDGQELHYPANTTRVESRELPYEGLRCRCQCDRSDLGASAGGSYAWEVVYEYGCRIDLDRAETMAKTLAGLDRKLKAFTQDEGLPRTFGQYANRFARGLGIAECYVKRAEPLEYAVGLAATHRKCSPGELVGAVDELVAEWHRSGDRSAA